jgi:predicted metal-binding protein
MGLKAFAKYARLARRLGAADALVIAAGDVVVDGRAYLKCLYGCKGWNANWTCPSAPGALKPWEFEPLLRRYRGAVLIHCGEKRASQAISGQVEAAAFRDGHYFAFAMSDCALCKRCSYPGKPCRDPARARPAMQGLGIDVFATVHKFGLPLATLADRDAQPQNWYSLVLIA